MATNGKINIEDIEKDGSRWVLDSVDKIVFWIESNLKEKTSLKNNMPPFRCINFLNALYIPTLLRTGSLQ